MTFAIHQRDAELRGEARGIEIGKQAGMMIGEKRGKQAGMMIGEKRGKQAGMMIGEKRGKQAGISLAKHQTAQKMLRRNMPLQDIADITDLSIETIEQLQAELMTTSADDRIH